MSRPSDFFGPLPPNVTPTQGRRNYLINGNFDIWQRATSQTASGYGSDDRWYNTSGGSTKTASRQAFTLGQIEVPGNPKYFSRTVVSSVVGATNHVQKMQKIESVTSLSGKTATLSFWAKADAAKNIAVEFAQQFGTGGSPSAFLTDVGKTIIPLTTAWKKFTVTTSIPSVSGKTIGTDNNDNLYMIFWFDAGSSYSSRASNIGQQSGTFDIAQVQLEEGLVATEFERRTIGDELRLCQRYYERSISPFYSSYAGYAHAAAAYSATTSFKVEKRALPVVTLTTIGQSAFPTTFVLEGVSPTGFIETRTASGTGGGLFGSYWTADSEL